MKRRLLILIALLFIHYACLFAVSAYPYPINIIQPDGSKITILLKGDEYFNYAQTTDGFIISRNTKGVYEYADIDTSNEIKPSGIKANNKKERDAKEIQYIQALQKEKILERLLLKQNNTILKQQSIQDAGLMSTITTTSLTGTLKILCVLIGFQDEPFSKTQTEFNNLMNQTGYSVGAAIGSVKDFYLENSYGQLNLEITVVGPYIADHNMDYYGANDANGNDIRPRNLIIEAVQKANPAVNYADYDNNNDGYVDGVHVIYAGYAEAAGAPAETIWPHKWTIPDLTLDGKKISAYSCTSELRYTWGTNISGIGTICHEFGHILGASDFYDTNYATGGQYIGAGQWDLMAEGSWNGNEDIPAHHNPYTKTQIYNWATVQNIPSDNTLVTLNPANSNSDSFYKIPTPTSGEYFLIENRQWLGFDASLPGHGMLVWHVHKDIESDRYAINITHPQRFYPICASATQNPTSTPTSYGTVNGGGCPFPGTSTQYSLTYSTIPGLRSWADVSTGKNIQFITETGNNVTFVVNPQISGPSSFSGQATYTLQNLPAGATAQWSVNDVVYLDLVSQNERGDTAVFQSDYYGFGIIYATITINNTDIVVSRYVYTDVDLTPLNNCYISASDFACGTASFTMLNLPGSSVVRWSCDAGIGYSTDIDPTYSFYTYTYPDSRPGVDKMKAQITYKGKTQEWEHEFNFNFNRNYVYYPVGDTILYDYGFYSNNGLAAIDVQYNYPFSWMSSEWSASGGWHFVDGSNEFATFEGPTGVPDIMIELCFDTPCGGRTCYQREFAVPQSLYRGSTSAFSLSPNPASDNVTISLADDTKGHKSKTTMVTATSSDSYEIQLWNPFGLVKQVTTDQPKYQLSLSGVPAGFYYVHVIKDKMTYRKQLIIKY